jgi:hypothetical protein
VQILNRRRMEGGMHCSAIALMRGVALTALIPLFRDMMLVAGFEFGLDVAGGRSLAGDAPASCGRPRPDAPQEPL